MLNIYGNQAVNEYRFILTETFSACLTETQNQIK